MKLAGRVWPVAALFVTGLASLFVPGVPGDIAAFVWLGVLPGLALARLLVPTATMATRWTLGVALAPVASTVAGWALLHAGQPLTTAARLVAIGGWVLFAGGEARPATETPGDSPGGPDARSDRVAWGWSLVASAFVVLPALVNPWTRVRSDSWVHAGITWEIALRGIPPQDPRFAGQPLHYVWFYNLFLALLHALRPESSPFTHMVTANACWIATLVWLGWQLAWALWRERRAARAALPLLLTGLNAGAILLWPLWLLRAVRGEVRGVAEVRRITREVRLDRVDIMHQLSAPFAWMVNSWDKFMIGTALGYAYVLLLVALWAAIRWLGDDPAGRAVVTDEAPGEKPRTQGSRPSRRWLFVAFVAAVGMMLFHSVVGLSVIPVSIGACLLLALPGPWARTMRSPVRPLALAAAFLAGLVAAWPYFRSISSGWAAAQSGIRHAYFHIDWRMPWTLVTACAVTAVAAWPGTRRVLADRAPAGTWLVFWLGGMTAFATIVTLPENNEFKFVWQVFAPLAILGSYGMPSLLAAGRRRLGDVASFALAAVVFVLPALLLEFAFLVDPSGATAPETHREPGEPELYAWVRNSTTKDAVFVDDRSRDVLLVEGRRRLLAGTPFGPERAAFPADVLARRREVTADLYGSLADPSGDVALLDALGSPVYVVYRERDFPNVREPALAADTNAFERAFADRDHVVYRRRR